jgi:hypothetical protein
MNRDKQEGPRYRGPSCLRPCCTIAPANRCRISPALTSNVVEFRPAHEGMLNEQQAAQYLGLKLGSLRSGRCRKRGPAYIKLGRRVLYRMDDLRTYVDARRVDPTAA